MTAIRHVVTIERSAMQIIKLSILAESPLDAENLVLKHIDGGSDLDELEILQNGCSGDTESIWEVIDAEAETEEETRAKFAAEEALS